jgi:hypothetical protein
MRIWTRRGGWGRRIALTLLAALLLYGGTQVALGLLQADFDHRTFDSGEPENLQLDEGARLNVYLTPGASAPLNFDFYASDLDCELTGPDTTVLHGTEIHDEHRFVDGWRSHWGVEAFNATESGAHELLCTDRGHRTYPLILARPSSIKTYRVHPRFGLVLVVLSGIVLTATLAGTSRRRTPRHERIGDV